MALATTFTEQVTCETALREIISFPNEAIRRKQLSVLDTHCSDLFINI